MKSVRIVFAGIVLLAALFLCLASCGRSEDASGKTSSARKTSAADPSGAPSSSLAPSSSAFPDETTEEAEEIAHVLSPEERDRILKEKFGVAPSSAAAPAPDENSLFARLAPLRVTEYVLPLSYPSEITVKVSAPDLEKLFAELLNENLPDAEAFEAALLQRLDAGRFELRRTEVRVTVEGPDFDPSATENFELLDALYGGALSFYRNAYLEDLRIYYSELTAQETSVPQGH